MRVVSKDGTAAAGLSAEQCLDAVTFISSNSLWSLSWLQQSNQSNKTEEETEDRRMTRLSWRIHAS